jgi:hypothetical protein
MSSEPYEGMWDWEGACAPDRHGARYTFETFSVGCFQWVRRGKNGGGKGLKKGKVQYRIKGRTDEAERVYASATAYCAKKNAELAQ